MSHRRPLWLTLILCLTLVFAGPLMAVARGEARAGGTEVVLCAGGIDKRILLDTRGKPLGPAHLCPDCVAGAAAILPDVPVCLIPPAARPARVRVVAPRRRGTRPRRPRARGPPRRSGLHNHPMN